MNSIDCLLIQPPFWRRGVLPHSDRHTACEGILSIATFLQSKGYSVKVFFTDEFFLDGLPDRGKDPFPFDKVKQIIKDCGPRIVGIGAHTFQYPISVKILKLCKEINPEITTVIGGPHVTFMDKECFQDSEDIDIVVRGEGEWTMLDVVQHVLNGEVLDDVKGITFRKNSSAVRNMAREHGNLEELPSVDYSQVDPQYMRKCNFLFTFTRGCPFKCAYCVERKIWGQKMRVRRAEKIIEEMSDLVPRYTDREIFIGFLASVFNVPESFFKTMCRELRQFDFGDRIVAVLASANHLPEEHVKLMKKAGITRILMAIESASEKVLKMMNKKISFDLAVEKCRLIKKYGLEVGTFWLFGHPGETPDTARRSLEAMVYLWENGLNDIQEVAIFNPYPGTVFYDHPQKYGLKILTDDWERFSRFDEPIISLDQFPHEKLCEYFDEARKIAHFWPSIRKYMDSKQA
jgi:anaerobic magnesium-protoporphyrin IX monomethyl ester cyclase